MPKPFTPSTNVYPLEERRRCISAAAKAVQRLCSITGTQQKLSEAQIEFLAKVGAEPSSMLGVADDDSPRARADALHAANYSVQGGEKADANTRLAYLIAFATNEACQAIAAASSEAERIRSSAEGQIRQTLRKLALPRNAGVKDVPSDAKSIGEEVKKGFGTNVTLKAVHKANRKERAVGPPPPRPPVSAEKQAALQRGAEQYGSGTLEGKPPNPKRRASG